MLKKFKLDQEFRLKPPNSLHRTTNQHKLGNSSRATVPVYNNSHQNKLIYRKSCDGDELHHQTVLNIRG